MSGSLDRARDPSADTKPQPRGGARGSNRVVVAMAEANGQAPEWRTISVPFRRAPLKSFRPNVLKVIDLPAECSEALDVILKDAQRIEQRRVAAALRRGVRIGAAAVRDGPLKYTAKLFNYNNKSLHMYEKLVSGTRDEAGLHPDRARTGGTRLLMHSVAGTTLA